MKIQDRLLSFALAVAFALLIVLLAAAGNGHTNKRFMGIGNGGVLGEFVNDGN